MRMFVGGKEDPTNDDELPEPSELISVLEHLDAHGELAIAWRLIVLRHGVAGKYELASEAAERSVEHARRAGNQRLVARIGGNLADFALLGPMPAYEAIATCERLIADGLSDRQVEGKVMCKLARLRAMTGELAMARDLYRRGRTMLQDLGQGVIATATGSDLALVEMHGGDLALAEREVRIDLAFLAQKGETYYRSSMAALLSRLVRDQGRDDEALEISKSAETIAAANDVVSQSWWRSFRAPILARAGQFTEAEGLARTAVELARKTEAPFHQAEALYELAVVLSLVRKTDEARETIEQAISLHKRKGNIVMATRCSQWASVSP
jgi:tetratricopeptide (TPR) repeat protein